MEAIDEVFARVKTAHPSADHMVWINLREEPIVYVNGAPYCLRRERFSLRNMKGERFFVDVVQQRAYGDLEDYGGISASRLEVLEERLKEDVIAELTAYGGRYDIYSECYTSAESHGSYKGFYSIRKLQMVQ